MPGSLSGRALSPTVDLMAIRSPYNRAGLFLGLQPLQLPKPVTATGTQPPSARLAAARSTLPTLQDTAKRAAPTVFSKCLLPGPCGGAPATPASGIASHFACIRMTDPQATPRRP